jgi:hypothetical protein
MIEASPHLRKQQSRLLCGNDSLKETELGWTNTCKYLPGCNIIWCEDLRFVPKGMSHNLLNQFDLRTNRRVFAI